MKILVLGSSGRTGSLVVEHALANGHEVTVMVRRSRYYNNFGVRVIEGDALNAGDVLRAMYGQHAVVQCIGGNAPWRYQTLERESMRNIIDAMESSRTRRLVVVSAMGVDESVRQSPWWYRLFVLPTFLRGITADKSAMEAMVRGSEIDWVIARAPILTDGLATGKVRELGMNEIGHTITRYDLAAWMVTQLERVVFQRKAVVVVNR